MSLPAVGLLICCLGALWLFVRNDVADYAAFRRLSDTGARQKHFRLWVLKSLALFAGATVLCLALLSRLADLTHSPVEFAPLSKVFHSSLPTHNLLDGGFVAGFIVAVTGALLLSVVVARRRGASSKPMILGNLEPLMPRNWAETGHVALLALNAGFSEELFFRLLLPLLLALVTGSAVVAFALAAIIFGLIHIYQGWIGVVTTTILGLVLTGLYLGAASLWLPIVAHVAIDLMNLVVRPTLARLSARAKG